MSRFILSPQNHLHFVLQSLLFYSSYGYSTTRLDSSSRTKDNLVPIRLDIEIDGQHFKDAFTWNPVDPDSESEVVVFAKRTVKDLKHPPEFITQIVQSIQGYGYPRPECWACCCICNKGTTLRDIRCVNLARESRLSKKGHRGFDYYPAMSVLCIISISPSTHLMK
ncbi:hypothetical protein SAY86_028040 [Trapa natans]|uniref:Uncharacterized protein n=1 Tax=Trapa natans TaxID=22666 RepID=A0AAN7M003_TRANT|nr:hypothetical protein SAY86_028040 [Trapa natans]